MEVNMGSSKHMGHERTNSYRETVKIGQPRREEECGNVMSSLVILSVTGFGDSWGEGTRDHRSRQGGSSFRKRIGMLIPRDTSVTRDLLEV